MTSTGYPPRVIDELEMDDLADLFAYWKVTPPSHTLLARLDGMMAAYLGIKRDPVSSKPTSTTSAAASRELAMRYGRKKHG
jgi:hypothetical protein